MSNLAHLIKGIEAQNEDERLPIIKTLSNAMRAYWGRLTWKALFLYSVLRGQGALRGSLKGTELASTFAQTSSAQSEYAKNDPSGVSTSRAVSPADLARVEGFCGHSCVGEQDHTTNIKRKLYSSGEARFDNDGRRKRVKGLDN